MRILFMAVVAVPLVAVVAAVGARPGQGTEFGRSLSAEEIGKVSGGASYDDARCMLGTCLQFNNQFKCVGWTSNNPADAFNCVPDNCYTSCYPNVGYYCLAWSGFDCTLSDDPMDLVGCGMGTHGTCPATWTWGLPSACTYGACVATAPVPCLPIPQVCT